MRPRGTLSGVADPAYGLLTASEPSATSCSLVALSAGHAGLSCQRSSAKGDRLR
jgi:hypothetical protein